MKSAKQIKARASFEINVKQASKCREQKKIISCFSCPQEKTCEIQKRLEKARANMY